MTDDEPTLIERLRKLAEAEEEDGGSSDLSVMLEAADELEAWEQAFTMYWEANRRATELYQLAHPGITAFLPDQGKVTGWLVDEIERLRKIEETYRYIVKDTGMRELKREDK